MSRYIPAVARLLFCTDRDPTQKHVLAGLLSMVEHRLWLPVVVLG